VKRRGGEKKRAHTKKNLHRKDQREGKEPKSKKSKGGRGHTEPKKKHKKYSGEGGRQEGPKIKGQENNNEKIRGSLEEQTWGTLKKFGEQEYKRKKLGKKKYSKGT